MPEQLAEAFRLISNLIRIGSVASVDLSARPAKVRVTTGGLQTDWLPWVEARAGTTKTWSPPSVGERVVVLSPDGDLAAGVALAGINCDAQPAPSSKASEHVIVFPDGARIVYDHDASALTATGITTLSAEVSGQTTLQCAGQTTIQCPQITLDGNVTVTGLLSYLAGMSGTNGQGNATTISGDITHVGGNLSSHGVVLHTHTHGGVYSGSDNTAGPN